MIPFCRYLMWLGVAIACLLYVHWSSAAEPGPEAQVDRIFSKWNKLDVPGGSVGIIHDGNLIYAKGFGAAQLDYGAPNTPETIFDVGSAAKSFTCACIALLLDRGKISVDDDVRKFIPELQTHEPPIRIRDLICCRSGTWDQWHLAQLVGWSSEPIQAPYTDSDLLTLLAGQKTLPFKPGTQFQYSSSDYFLLGLVIGRVTGKSLAEFARQSLFEPLGMTRTYFEEASTKIVKNRAIGYDQELRNGEIAWQSWTSQAAGAGGCNLKTSIADLARWDQNFANNRLGGGSFFNTFLNEGTLLDNRNVLDAMPTGQYRGLKRMQFTGGMPGYAAAIARFPEQKFTVICLSNSDISPWDMSQQIADIYLSDKLEPLPEEPRAAGQTQEHITTSVEEMQEMVGAFRAPDRRIWRCSFKEGRLWMTDMLDDTYVLRPVGSGKFSMDSLSRSTLIFKRSTPDARFELTVESDDGSMKFDRVELVEPSAVKLSDYVGDFRSSELAATYTVEIKEDGLYIRANSHGFEKLAPTVADEFTPYARRLFDNRIFTFQRDGSNQVTGLKVALWRIKGIEFQKQ
jgi:CubicO group peptidase (beta-lactamase class C family)